MIAELTNTDAATIAEAARRGGVHVNTVRKWIDRGHLQVVATPLGRVIVRESLEDFLRDRAQVEDKAIASRGLAAI